MRTGVSYMGHHNPKHIRTDMAEMARLGLDDVFVAAQENDFLYFPGKVRFAPQIAQEYGLRPIAIFWGALNLFGGGRSSQFLLENPAGFQVARDGGHRAAGCYVNPFCVRRIQEMIDAIVEMGYAGYFIDEPTPLDECFCPSCQARYAEYFDGALLAAAPAQQTAFRRRCVIDYVAQMADYCKANHPALETMCCLMPQDRTLWQEVAALPNLDNLGTDIYWTNEDRDWQEAVPLLREMDALCKARGKVHHEWIECWRVKAGKEPRIREYGDIVVREQPDALYIWAWEGQIGMRESCEDPERAWAEACRVLAAAQAGVERGSG